MTPLCDMCSESDPVWVHPALSFPVEIDGIVLSNSIDEWYACSTCHQLIEAGDRDALAIRSADRFMMDHPEFILDYKSVVSQLQQVHDQFFQYRYGESHPVEVKSL